MSLLKVMLVIAAGPGASFALFCAVVFGSIGFAGASLTEGVSQWGVGNAVFKGAFFGAWIGFMPFAIYSVVRLLLLGDAALSD